MIANNHENGSNVSQEYTKAGWTSPDVSQSMIQNLGTCLCEDQCSVWRERHFQQLPAYDAALLLQFPSILKVHVRL